MLGSAYRVQLLPAWQGEACDLLIALHARRSAASIADWVRMAPGRPLVVVLTGTDLYRDIQVDRQAQAALRSADALVVLQEDGLLALPPAVRSRARVIYQSGNLRQTLPKSPRHLRAIMVGHLRSEKSPQTLFAAARLLRERPDIRIDHIGAALDPALGAQARATQAGCPAYRWLGALPHPDTLRRIQRAHLLVLTSAMEGGAHVILEAVRSGTPVLASDVPGNRGMLGAQYAGYFPCADARALAGLMVRARDEPAFRDRLGRQCAARDRHFEPAREQRALHGLVAELLA